ncbi:hypothetical protein [Caballeronia sp. dw_19]|uniref:hypothetical protein n=1 Tax=Caballeronia sp. dw_19 TaxID=2719791 RepID=UPI001BD423CC|nr:hypothetical protein [Caballeronia sp. dw_19]
MPLTQSRPIGRSEHLRVGRYAFQLYSLATPNGVKATVTLEEMSVRGHSGAEYHDWLIKIGDVEQFGSGFGEAASDSKIPGTMDRSANCLNLEADTKANSPRRSSGPEVSIKSSSNGGDV